MRTTVRLDDDLLLQAKRAAAESGRTLTSLIEDALREALARSQASRARPKRVTLRTVAGRGPQAGVDLDSSAALLALMDEHAAR